MLIVMGGVRDHDGALDRILLLVVLLNDDMTRTLARDDLTPSRAHLMWELVQNGPSTQRDLAKALDVSARNITGLVDALVATGHVTRGPHPTDRRAILVSFTERGARVGAALRTGKRELAGLLFDEMSDRRFACFVAGLDEVVTRLREALGRAS